MVDIVLASKSETRIRLLGNAGLDVLAVPPRLDEEGLRAAFLHERTAPRDIADALAEAKARKVSSRVNTGHLVLGCDQILAIGDQIVTKSDCRDRAAETLLKLSGRTHQLFSAAVICQDGAPIWQHVATARLTMRNLDQKDIDTYLDRCWPQVASSVGCYQIENEGIRLFERLEGSFFAILGLPLEQVVGFLIGRGDLAP